MLSVFYAGIVNCRNLYYNIFGPQYRPKLPVISVGNLSTGGTGKTPHCLWLAIQLRQKGYESAIVMRGYQKGGGLSDEAEIYKNVLGSEAVFFGADRISNIKILEKQNFDCILLDDGFQHRQVARDLDLVLIDSTHPPMSDAGLPRGFLRESIQSLNRANLVIWTRCEMLNLEKLAQLESQLGLRFPILPQFKSRTVCKGLVSRSGKKINPEGKQFFLVCGIGQPKNFMNLADQEGLSLCGQSIFSDHHAYTRKEIEKVVAEAKNLDADALLMTEKDVVKWNGECDLPVAIMKISPQFEDKKSERLLSIVLDKIKNHAS